MQFFYERMPQIQTQNDKNTRKFRNLKILCNFCLFFEKLGGLECQRRSTRKIFVAREGFIEEIEAICVEKMHQIWTEIDKILENSDF